MDIEFFKSAAFSLALLVIAAVWISKYGTARKGRKYAERRATISQLFAVGLGVFGLRSL